MSSALDLDAMIERFRARAAAVRARQIPPATLAWIRAGVYWTIAMLFLFY